MSGPLLDRIDMQIEVRRLSEDELLGRKNGEGSGTIRKRVEKARSLQQRRLAGSGFHCNAQMNSAHLKAFCFLDQTCESLIRNAIRRLNLSARSFDKILKVARTIADLLGETDITAAHLAEAIQYRGLDRKFTP